MNNEHDVIDAILKLDQTSPDFRDLAACTIKKFVHGEKMSIYHRIFLDLKYGPRKPRSFKKHAKQLIDDFVKTKIETHKQFSQRDVRKQIWGLFDWKK